MSEHAEFDLVAIGGGFAGLVAAVRGAELGLRTAVLEQGRANPIRAARAGPAGSFTSPTTM
jgi:succinate dehydrogenase/fumarate reductase flavoprotein subunit